MDFEFAFAIGWGKKVKAGEFLLEVFGAGGGGVDEADVAGEDFAEGGDEERVVGAGEHEGVDALFDEGIEVGAEDLLGGGVCDPVFLDEGDEEWGGLAVDDEAGAALGEGVLIGVGADGSAGGDDADALRFWIGEGGFDAGFDDADDGDAVVLVEDG